MFLSVRSLHELTRIPYRWEFVTTFHFEYRVFTKEIEPKSPILWVVKLLRPCIRRSYTRDQLYIPCRIATLGYVVTDLIGNNLTKQFRCGVSTILVDALKRHL